MNRTVIIGGGAIGLSLAYHLTRADAGEVILLERNRLTSGTSWHAAGIVGPLRATANMTRLAQHAIELFPRLEDETGLSTGYRTTGGYWLAREPERMDELHRIAALGSVHGLSPRVLLSGDEIGRELAEANTDVLVGGMFVAEDASVDPVDLCMTYAKAAKDRGADLREGAEVTWIVVERGRACGVLLVDGTIIEADAVALCAGAWSSKLAREAGLELPLQPVQHMYVVTEPRQEFLDLPVLRDLDRGTYIKANAGSLIIGGFDHNAICWDPEGPEANRPFLELADNWDQIAPFLESACELIPRLGDVGIRRFMNGPESFTADTKPLIGEAPEVDRLFVAAGMNSVGIMSSAGVGHVMAELITEGRPPFDLWEVDVARADPRSAGSQHLSARMAEAVSDQFELHWPYKQPKAGRDLRRSSLHDCWAEQGAIFGVTAGWERGLWYAAHPDERNLRDSVKTQPWWPIAAREAEVMTDGAALLDLSPFSRFLVEGPGALGILNQLAAAQIDRPIGRSIYTSILNSKGGIEADLTIVRTGPQSFLVTSGAATRWKDLAFLRRAGTGQGYTITDLTGTASVIGVMGAAAREILGGVLATDLFAPFGTSQESTFGGASLRSTRLSFVGELGWELAISAPQDKALFEVLIANGARPMGHFALDGCRLEKGFVHWGHDVGPTITPLEAGLGAFIDWNKSFVGKEALMPQKSEGITRRLTLFEVDGVPLLLHDEPIFEGGKVVGLTTSGGYGPRTGKHLAFGLVDIAPGETPVGTVGRRFEIQVADQMHAARALSEPPFDPSGSRMRL